MSSTWNLRLPAALAAAAACGLAAPAAALAGESHSHVVTDPALPGVSAEIFPSVTSTVVAGKAVNRSCIDRLRSGKGVARLTYTAPADGQLTAHLKGTGVRDDWDLALFNADGRRLEGSGAFFTNEVAKGFARRGEKLTIQVCRLKGADRTMPLETTFVGVPLTSDASTPKMKFLKVRILGKAEYERLEALAATTSLIDVTHDVQDGRAMVIAYTPETVDRIRAAGFVVEVVDHDMAATFRSERAKDRAYTRKAGLEGSPLPSGRTEYRVLEDFYSELKKLADENPALVRPVALKGKTAEGRDVPVVEIAANVQSPAEGRPYFILDGIHHAREWPAAETPLEFAIDLVKNYGKDPRVTKILDTTRVIVQPLTNADGYNNSRSAPIDPDPDNSGMEGLYNITGASPGPAANAYRRKNCNFPFPTVVPCELQLGVDPNRNYPNGWGGPGASSNPHSQTWRGPSAGSEPEIKAVRELVSQFQATSLIAMHNVAALVLRPPGLEEDGFAPDEEGLKALGDKMAEATGYTSQYGWQLYDTTGTTDDWSYAATGGYAYTIEIGPSGGEFHMNYETGVINQYLGIDEYAGKGLREAFLLGAEHASDPAANSRVVGRAPAGRTLRLKKEFKTLSYTVCAVSELTPVTGGDTDPDYCASPGAVQETDEKIETTMVVPASGRFTYWMNPSTRPFVKKDGKTETYTLTCENNGAVVETHTITIDRGQAINLDMPCGGTLVEDATPIKAKAKSKKALKKCMAKAKKSKGKAKRKKAQKACQKKYGKR
jgi:hypothetical protein